MDVLIYFRKRNKTNNYGYFHITPPLITATYINLGHVDGTIGQIPFVKRLYVHVLSHFTLANMNQSTGKISQI